MSWQRGKHVGNHLEQTTRLVKLSFSQLFNAIGADITPEQWVVLDSVAVNDGCPQTSIAKQTFKDAPTISRIIDQLCKKGYTERKVSESDRRSYNVHLTSKGEQFISDYLPHVKKAREKVWKDLSEDEYHQLMKILNKIFENLS